MNIPRLRDLLANNIRLTDTQDDDELRASLQQFGWRKELPAITDEHGSVLVGNRRLRLAKELGIDSVINLVKFGQGDQADAERVKLAIASNTGTKPMTKKDRQRIAQYLYGEREWTMERIAEALNTTHKTISKDLSTFVPPVQTRKPTIDKLGRKNTGRPKTTTTRKRREQAAPAHDKAREVVRSYVEADAPVPRSELATKHGVSPNTIQRAELAERAAKEAREDPYVDPTTLPRSAQEKLAATLRQQGKKLAADFDRRVSEGIQEALKDTVLPHFRRLQADYYKVLNSRRGVMSREKYRLILSCLHPDSRGSTSDQKLREAFATFKKQEVVLVAEKENPTPTYNTPSTYEDLMKMRQRNKNGAKV